MSEPPALRLFLDRSTQGRRFVAAVRELVADVETIDDRYGRDEAQRVPDVRWIAEATADGRILVGDHRYLLRIRDLPAEAGPWVYRISRHDLARLPLRCDDL